MKGAAFDVNNGRACFQNLRRASRILLVASLVLISWGFSGCGDPNDQGGISATGTNDSKEASSVKSADIVEILLFNGTGSMSW